MAADKPSPSSAKINQAGGHRGCGRKRGRVPAWSHHMMQKWMLLLGIMAAAVASYFIMLMGQKHQVVLGAELQVPAHLVDYATQYQFVFVVIYERDQARPLAVMKEPLQVRVNRSSRLQGYHRRVVVTLSKLEFMQLPGAMATPPAYEQLAQGLAGIRAQPPAAQQLSGYEFKLLLDQDGVVGGEQMSSLRTSFYLGQTNIPVNLQLSTVR